MSTQKLDYRPIVEIAEFDLQSMPVAISLGPDGTSHVVSRFLDNVWDFYPYITIENRAPKRKEIDWNISLPDGSLLTDSKHSYLLQSSKAFIWSLFSQPVEGKKRPSMSSLIVKADNLIPLLRWMNTHGLVSFREITKACVPTLKLHASQTKLASPGTIYKRLQIIEDLYRQRDKLHDAIDSHPWPHETALSLSGLRSDAANRRPKTEPIPEGVANRIATAAIDLILTKSTKILVGWEEANRLGSLVEAEGGDQYRKSKQRTIAAKKNGFSGISDLHTEALMLRTACYIVICMFSGVRDSEMMALDTDCISHRRSKDDSCDTIWLNGKIYKSGTRPKAWQIPPIVEKAVAVLKTLSHPLRLEMMIETEKIQNELKQKINSKNSQLIKRLSVLRQQVNKLFLGQQTGGAISVISGASMGKHLKRFCLSFDVLDSDGKGYPLHSHQFRRTYACYMAKAELGDLVTLQNHFGHSSLDETLFYASDALESFDTDVELLEMVGQEKRAIQRSIVKSHLISNEPLANGGHWLYDWRRSVQTAANKEELINQYSDAITLNGTGHSWCVGSAKAQGCGGLCIFEAQLCVDCKYGVIGPEHRNVWNGIKAQQQEALAMNDLGIVGIQRAKEILRQAEKVLERLNEVKDGGN